MNTLLTELCSYLGLKPEHTELLNERDTSDVWRQFAIWLLIDPEHGVLRFTNPGSLQYNAINRVAQLYIEDCKDADAWQKAGAKAAYYGSYVYKADYAAWHASQAASCAACAAGAPYGARASYAAAAAWAAARAAARASTAEAEAHRRMADKLLELLQLAPPKEAP